MAASGGHWKSGTFVAAGGGKSEARHISVGELQQGDTIISHGERNPRFSTQGSPFVMGTITKVNRVTLGFTNTWAQRGKYSKSDLSKEVQWRDLRVLRAGQEYPLGG